MKNQIVFSIVIVAMLTTYTVLISGCTEAIDVPPTGPPSTQPTKVGAIACLMKDGKPFIMVNMAPELPNFGKAGKQAKEDYLQKRAAEVIIDFALTKEEYEGKDTFVVRMVLLDGKDDYNRPKWGSAVNLAFLELKREPLAGLSKDGLATIPKDKLGNVFSSVQWK
jgi:hypothetical protein